MDRGDSRPELSSLSEKRHCSRVRSIQQRKNNSHTAVINGKSRQIIFQITQLIQITSWAFLAFLAIQSPATLQNQRNSNLNQMI